ncbi:AI-2E family transporter [Lacisediminihabitans changchengi]|uniref:AI-2E family transporter n=1 Tax=Lacisediminihabitans changchengi TaxID=2787634 RepID=A0A934SV28_9MICO|nr:AI-2E family transporter [Lacisediminihabitans changchengi]MBK4348569.1 AI-2E family transporter [Lacisediminihabitans changchengi]
MWRTERAKTVTDFAVAERAPAALWTDVLGRLATRCLQALIVLAVVSLVVYAAVQLKLVVIPVLIALIVASAFRPLVRVLEKHMPRIIAAILSLLAGVIVLGGIVTIAVFQVQSQFSSLQKSVTNGITAVGDFIQSGDLPIGKQQIADIQKTLTQFVTSADFGTGALAGVTTGASIAIELITGTVLAVIVLFYFMKDGPMIWAFLISPFTPILHAKLRRGGDSAVQSLGGYVRGTTIVALVDAVCIGIGMLILRVPLAIPLAIVVFIAAFIPLVGATAAGIIAALVTLVTVDLTAAIVVAIIVIAVQQLEGNFLSPVVLGRSLQLHGLVVLVALTAGTILGGIVGTLLSVPTAAVAWAVIKQWNDPIVPEPGIDTPEPARTQEFEKRRSPRERAIGS